MIQTMSYSEMNHAVPGSTLNAHMERSLGCEVPSPSQWSDPCRSPLSLHSPVHFWGELEKIKEEPYSPPSNGSIIVLPRYRTSKDAQGETSINFTDLVSDSSAISNQRHLLESTGAQDHLNFRVKPEVDKRYLPFELDFLDDFVDVKTDEPFFGALSIPPAAPPLPQPTSSLGDRLRIVELMALDHWRQDIQNVSERLNIPKDPTAWSVADVRTWLEFEAEQQGLPPPPVAHSWNFTGMDLMLLTEAQFRKLIPHGQLLYAKLEIWLEALRSSNDDHLEHLSPPESSASSSPPPPPAYAGPPPGSTLQTPPSRLTPPRLYAQPLSPSLELPTPVIRAECPAKSKCPDDPATPRKRQRNHQTPSPHIRGSFLEEACLDMSSLLEEETDNLSPVPSKRNSRLATISSTEIATSVAEEGAEEEPNCGRSGTHIHLWQFLKELLVRPQLYAPYIRWLDRKAGIFKIEDSTRVARLWGERKNRPAMNYDKLSRSIRQYYKKGIMKKTERSQRLVYQFCHPYGA